MPNSGVVSLKNVTVVRGGETVLEDLTLSVDESDFLAVIGPNGSGKTTLLKVILGLIEPDAGDVWIVGHEPKDARMRIGYLPQKFDFDHSFPINVFDVVLMGRYSGLFHRYTKDDRDATEMALATVGMSDFLDRQIGKLSGGQIQRVFLARAIVKDPRLLLLDEPTASIDPEMQSSFYELINELKEKMAVIMVTHDIGVSSVHVDKIACINKKLFYHGSVEGGLKHIEELYECPVEIVAHGVPHRVMGRHDHK